MCPVPGSLSIQPVLTEGPLCAKRCAGVGSVTLSARQEKGHHPFRDKGAGPWQKSKQPDPEHNNRTFSPQFSLFISSPLLENTDTSKSLPVKRARFTPRAPFPFSVSPCMPPGYAGINAAPLQRGPQIGVQAVLSLKKKKKKGLSCDSKLEGDGVPSVSAGV